MFGIVIDGDRELMWENPFIHMALVTFVNVVDVGGAWKMFVDDACSEGLRSLFM